MLALDFCAVKERVLAVIISLSDANFSCNLKSLSIWACVSPTQA